jgi:Ca-activated chloride channel family protein
VNTLFGPRYVYQQVDLDEDTLMRIARTTGGQYFRATDTESLKNIYARIDNLEKSKVKVKEYTEYNELFSWPLMGALSLMLVEIVLANTRFRKIP